MKLTYVGLAISRIEIGDYVIVDEKGGVRKLTRDDILQNHEKPSVGGTVDFKTQQIIFDQEPEEK